MQQEKVQKQSNISKFAENKACLLLLSYFESSVCCLHITRSYLFILNKELQTTSLHGVTREWWPTLWKGIKSNGNVTSFIFCAHLYAAEQKMHYKSVRQVFYVFLNIPITFTPIFAAQEISETLELTGIPYSIKLLFLLIAFVCFARPFGCKSQNTSRRTCSLQEQRMAKPFW